jgi:hypothetical protein
LEERDGGAVSTQPCDVSDQSQLWSLGGQTSTEEEEKKEEADAITMLRPEPNSISLFCFSLMLPNSYEQKLLAMQVEANVSIFACDAFSVYSNGSIVVSHRLTTTAIESNLTCTTGGEFGTVLNLHIFLTTWTQVVKDGLYLQHDWTVKVDPDAVFLPLRLKGILRIYKEGGNGVFLNNCKFGLHGPLEVLSRRAVQAWSKGWPWCQAHFRQRCDGDCLWGEDMFIDQCLSKVLGVTRVNDFRLLVEDHCDAPSDWQSCRDTSRAAFHPFKTLTGYRHCLGNASRRKFSAGIQATSPHVSSSISSTTPGATTRAKTALPRLQVLSTTTPEIALR